MATTTLECDYCGEPFEAKRRDARFCKPSHGAAYRRVAAEGSDNPPETPATADDPGLVEIADDLDLEHAGRVFRATYNELKMTSLLGTVHGEQALAAARDVDEADGPASRAVANRELRLTMMLARQVGNPFSPVRPVEDGDDDGEPAAAPNVPNLADVRARSQARKARASGR